MKTLLTALALALCLNAQALVLVYKNHLTTLNTGNFETKKTGATGYTVIDLDTAAVTIIYAYPKDKNFHLWNAYFSISEVHGAKAKNQTLWEYVQTGSFTDFVWLKGTNVKGVDIGDPDPLVNWTVPKSLTYLEKVSGTITGTQQTGIEEDSGTMTLDLKNTGDFNFFGTNYAEAITELTNRFKALGYLER